MRIRIIVSVFISILIEVFFFNFSVWSAQIRGITPMIIEKEQFSYLNWDETSGQLVSLPDPIVYIEGMDVNVRAMTLELDAEPMPQTCTIFYTTQQGETFSGEKMLIQELDPKTGRSDVRLPTKDPVFAIRIDPGEDAGIILNNVSIHINEFLWNISLSRIIAMLVIYWGVVGLMKLQKSPDYGIDTKQGEGETYEA